jgi:hypothetical protein
MSEEAVSKEVEKHVASNKRSCFGLFHWLTTVFFALVILIGVGFVHFQQIDHIARVEKVALATDGLASRIEAVVAAFESETFIAALQSQSTEMKSLHDGFEEDSETLSEGLAKLTELQEALESKLNKDTEKIVLALEEQAKEIRTVHEGFQNDTEKLSALLAEYRKFEDSLVESILEDGKSEAAQGKALARESWQKGEKELAMIFLLNAIKHYPDDIELYTQYATWAKQEGNPDSKQEAIAKLKNTIYAVAPDGVRTVSGLLNQLTPEEKPEPKEVEEKPLLSDLLHQQLAKIEQKPVLDLMTSLILLESRVDRLGSLVSQMESAEIDPDIKKKAEGLLREARSCLSAQQAIEASSVLVKNLDSAYQNLQEDETEAAETSVLSALKSAQHAINQIWSVPLDLIPETTRKEILEIPAAFNSQETQVRSLIEEREFEKAKGLWESGNGDAESFAGKIDARLQAMNGSMALLETFTTETGKAKARELSGEMSKAIADLSRQQNEAYQRWAMDTIEAARKIGTAPEGEEEKSPRQIILEGDFPLVDRALLSPGVGQFYQTVFSQIVADADGDATAEFEKQTAFPKERAKKKLADF